MLCLKINLVLIACLLCLTKPSEAINLKVNIDALNSDICGLAKYEIWQENQNAFSCNGTSSRTRRFVIGGSYSIEEAFPAHATLINDTFQSLKPLCGATIIHSNLILTSTRCFSEIRNTNFLVAVGSDKLGRSEIHRVVRICNASDKSVSIMKIRGMFRYTNFIRPICIPHHNVTKPDAICTVQGFGRNDYNYLDDNLKYIAVVSTPYNIKGQQDADTYYRAHKMNLETLTTEEFGGAVVCNDNCSGHGQQQYIKAVVTGGVPPLNIDLTAIDLTRLDSSMLDRLIATVLYDIPSADCVDYKQIA